MIELLNFTYKTNKVLFEGANFKAPSIGIIGIAGESGCGKTTFLKIISKQIHVNSMVNDAASIFYGNQDALLKRDLTIAQQFELIEPIYNREHDQNTIDELFNSLNIKASLSQKYDSCSLGEKKRIMIALSVYSNSPCIILDEPLFYKDYLPSTDAIYVIYPSNRGGYAAQGVTKTSDTNELKKDFPKEWVSKLPPYLRFCHSSRFLIAADNFDDIMHAVREALK